MSKTGIGEPTPEKLLDISTVRFADGGSWITVNNNKTPVIFFNYLVNKEIVKVFSDYNDLDKGQKVDILNQLKEWVEQELKINK